MHPHFFCCCCCRRCRRCRRVAGPPREAGAHVHPALLPPQHPPLPHLRAVGEGGGLQAAGGCGPCFCLVALLPPAFAIAAALVMTACFELLAFTCLTLPAIPPPASPLPYPPRLCRLPHRSEFEGILEKTPAEANAFLADPEKYIAGTLARADPWCSPPPPACSCSPHACSPRPSVCTPHPPCACCPPPPSTGGGAGGRLRVEAWHALSTALCCQFTSGAHATAYSCQAQQRRRGAGAAGEGGRGAGGRWVCGGRVGGALTPCTLVVHPP